MDILLRVVLPLSIAFIMFALGTGLKPQDFSRVVTEPLGFFTGFLAQVIFLPLTAFLLLMIFPLEGALAVGVMILAACPGGTTTSLISRLAGGNVALSVTLTAVISLLSVITMPLIVIWSVRHFQGAAAPEISATQLSLTMFAIAVVPALLGMGLRAVFPEFTRSAEIWFVRVATALFAIIVVGALAANWSTFISHLPVMGPVVIGLNVAMLAIGFVVAKLFGLPSRDARTISIEAGIQNSTLGIAVGSILSSATLGDYALPSAVYSGVLYLVTLPIVFFILRRL